MATMMTITGFPASLPQAEIKGLLETIGKVRKINTRGPGGSVALPQPFPSLSSDTLRDGRFMTLIEVLHVKQVVLSNRNGHSNFCGRVEKLDNRQDLPPQQFESPPTTFGVMFRSQGELRAHTNP